MEDKGSTCEHMERKESVNCFDDRGSAMESDGSKVQSATVSSSNGRAICGAGVELGPSKHLVVESCRGLRPRLGGMPLVRPHMVGSGQLSCVHHRDREKQLACVPLL